MLFFTLPPSLFLSFSFFFSLCPIHLSCRVYQRQGRSEEALGQCESSLQLLEGWERPGQACSVYKDMAAIEQAQGRLDRALEHLSKVRDI